MDKKKKETTGTKRVLLITAITGVALLCAVATAVAALMGTQLLQKQQHVLSLLPAAEVELATSFALENQANIWQNLPEDIKTAYNTLPVKWDVFFVLQNKDKERVYGYSVGQSSTNVNEVNPDWTSTVHGKYSIVSSKPLPVLSEELKIETLQDVLSSAKQERPWTYVSNTLQATTAVMPTVTIDAPVLIGNNSTLFLGSNTTKLQSFSRLQFLPNAAELGFTSEALQYMNEPERLLLISRIEYLWKKTTGIEDQSLDTFLQSIDAMNIVVEVQSDDSVAFSGKSNKPEALKDIFTMLESNVHTKVEWREVNRDLDTFKSSTIEHVETSSKEEVAAKPEAMTIGGFTVQTIDPLSMGYSDNEWFITSAPRANVEATLKGSIKNSVPSNTLAYGKQSTTAQLPMPLPASTWHMRLVPAGLEIIMEK